MTTREAKQTLECLSYGVCDRTSGLAVALPNCGLRPTDDAPWIRASCSIRALRAAVG